MKTPAEILAQLEALRGALDEYDDPSLNTARSYVEDAIEHVEEHLRAHSPEKEKAP